MYKCDKCGCEHNCRDACPGCGAPVVIVNEDYLRRRREWEERQKKGQAAEENGSLAERTVAAVLGAYNSSEKEESEAVDTEDGYQTFDSISMAKKDNERNKQRGGDSKGASGFALLREKLGAVFGTVRTAVLSRFSRAQQKSERKKRHAGDDRSLELESEEEQDPYEKMILDHIVFKSRIRKFVLIGAAALVLAAGAFIAAGLIRNRDRSDIRYFDGYELVSVQDGVLFRLDKEGGFALEAYSASLDGLLLKQGENGGLAGWYAGEEFALTSEMGAYTGQALFSGNGRYLAYVLYQEAKEDGEQGKQKTAGEYSLVLVDMKEQTQGVCSYDRMIDLIDITEDGRVLYTVMDTTGYSVVVNSRLYVAGTGTAEKNGEGQEDDNAAQALVYRLTDCLISSSVEEAYCNSSGDSVVFLEEDQLWLCDISGSKLEEYGSVIPAKALLLVDEEVLSILDAGDGEQVFYLKENGLWRYEKGAADFVVRGADNACTLYCLADGSLYYRRMNTLYAVSEGVGRAVITELSGDVLYTGEKRALLCGDREGRLYEAGKIRPEQIAGSAAAGAGQAGEYSFIRVIAGNVSAYNTLYGMEGYCAVCGDDLVYGEYSGKKYSVNRVSDNNPTAGKEAKVYYSRKYLYYVDSGSILWKMSKEDGTRESLGYVQIVVYRE